MEDFQRRAQEWARSLPRQHLKRIKMDGIMVSLDNIPTFNCSEEKYTYEDWGIDSTVTEMILEWENKMNKMNKMPEIESGMVIRYHHGNPDFLHLALVVGDYVITDYDAWCDLEDCDVITEVYSKRAGSWEAAFSLLDERLIWERESKDVSELKKVIADLEQNLETAKERLEALK